MTRPIVTYSSENWTLTAKDENSLRTFERQVLRKIFGLVNIDNIWRKRNNTEIDKLIEGADIVRFIKAQRIKWLGHIQRMDQARPTRKLLDWRPMGTRPVGRPRQRWQEDVMEDLKKAGRRQLRIEELGETWLRRRKPTKGCSAKWWWWWWNGGIRSNYFCQRQVSLLQIKACDLSLVPVALTPGMSSQYTLNRKSGRVTDNTRTCWRKK